MEDGRRGVSECIHWRRSVREFQTRPIEESIIHEILEAARWAPSSNNSQPWHFVVVRDPSRISLVAQAVPLGPKRINAWIAKAPVVIAACGRPRLFSHRLGRLIDKDYHRMDVAISVGHLVLAATGKGVGSCIVGWIHRGKIGHILGIPKGMDVVLLVALGYPADGKDGTVGIGGIPPRPRRSLHDIVSWEQYTWGQGMDIGRSGVD